MYKTYTQLERELTELHQIHDKLVDAYVQKSEELFKAYEQIGGLRRVCEMQSDKLMKMSSDLIITAISRERLMNSAPDGVKWAERTMTAFERSGGTVDYSKLLPDLFTTEEEAA